MHITSRAGAWVKLLPAILITVLIIITQTGCGEKDPVSKSDFCLDTTCDIKIYDMKTGEASEILDGAFEEIDRYENLMSKTIEGSGCLQDQPRSGAACGSLKRYFKSH